MGENALLLTIIFLPLIFALLTYCVGRINERARDITALVAVICTFALSLLLFFGGHSFELRLVDWGAFVLHFRLDGFRALYVLITAFLWLVTTIFAPQYLASSGNRNRYWLFNLLTFGAVMGVFFSADFRDRKSVV
jgi:hydrogenase-4 component B